jgi:hypothetical protein
MGVQARRRSKRYEALFPIPSASHKHFRVLAVHTKSSDSLFARSHFARA